MSPRTVSSCLLALSFGVGLLSCQSPASAPAGEVLTERDQLYGGSVGDDPWTAPDTGAAAVEDEDGSQEPGEGGEDTGASDEADESGGWVCQETFRNGSELCDDAAFTVPADGTPTALVCVTDLGGVGYVSRNTGPTMDDGIPRCQGWEEEGLDCAEYLDYIDRIDCLEEGAVFEVDLRPWAGETLWAGVHRQADGSGHFTDVCIATWED